MNDDQAGTVIDAILELAVLVRDEVGPSVTEAAHAVLTAADGDAVAALIVAAALIRTDLPVVTWWNDTRYRLPSRHRLAECGTVSAARRHRQRREPLDRACIAAEREYGRQRYHARKGAA